MAVGCGPTLAKILLIIFNIIFWLSGAALLGVGIWLIVDPNIVAHIDFIGLAVGAELLRYAAYVLIGVGSFVLIVGFFGCCGAIKENRVMLGIYIVFLVIIMGLEIACGILAFLYKQEIEDKAEEGLKEAFDDYYRNVTNRGTKNGKAFINGLDIVQKQFKCCGIEGPTDYSNAQPVGCKDAVIDWIKEKSVIFIGVGIGIACLELFGFIFAVCLCRNVGDED